MWNDKKLYEILGEIRKRIHFFRIYKLIDFQIIDKQEIMGLKKTLDDQKLMNARQLEVNRRQELQQKKQALLLQDILTKLSWDTTMT